MLPPREVEPTYTRVAHSPRSVPVQPAVLPPGCLRVLTQQSVVRTSAVRRTFLFFRASSRRRLRARGKLLLAFPFLFCASVRRAQGNFLLAFPLPLSTPREELDATVRRASPTHSPSCVDITFLSC